MYIKIRNKKVVTKPKMTTFSLDLAFSSFFLRMDSPGGTLVNTENIYLGWHHIKKDALLYQQGHLKQFRVIHSQK